MKKIYYEDGMLGDLDNKSLSVLVNKKKLIKYTQQVLHVSDWRKFWFEEYDWNHVDEMAAQLGDKVKLVEIKELVKR